MKEVNSIIDILFNFFPLDAKWQYFQCELLTQLNSKLGDSLCQNIRLYCVEALTQTGKIIIIIFLIMYFYNLDQYVMTNIGYGFAEILGATVCVKNK